jgi:hypothetical protein
VTACQSAPQPLPAEPPKTVVVRVPVDGKPCLNKADLPAAPVATRVDTKTASTAQLAAAVSVDQRNQDEYLQKLNAAILSCLH